jgi:iron complex transport system ATP-binding protein
MKLEIDAVAVALSGRRIVHEVTLQASPGEVVGLIGPNGSGKSTLLRAVYRMLRPEAGYVRLGDDDVWRMSARESARRTGVVVQETPSDFEFTVAEVVQMGRTPHKGMLAADTQDDVRIVMSALRRVNMAGFVERQFNTLSGGEKQRVLVARALAQEPKFLVLDEPTNHLDIHYQLEILELVRSLGITTLITLHDLNLAAAYCRRLYMLRVGQIVACGSPEEVLTPEQLRAVFLVDAIVGRHPTTGALQLAFVPVPHAHAGET